MTAVLLAAALLHAPVVGQSGSVRLPSVLMLHSQQSWGTPRTDRDVAGKPLRLGDVAYVHGLGMHANGVAVFGLERMYSRFHAVVGLDASMRGQREGSITFTVRGDRRTLYQSPVMRVSDAPRTVDVDVVGVDELTLEVGDAGDGINCDHGDWCDAVLCPVARTVARPGARVPIREVRSGRVSLLLDGLGGIVGARVGERRLQVPVTGKTRLIGLIADGEPVWSRSGAGWQCRRRLQDAAGGRRCTVVDRFRPDGDSVRWDVEIRGDGHPWSAPILSEVRWPGHARFWTAWGDPDQQGGPWKDPLESRPFGGRSLQYGGGWGATDGFAWPVATVLDDVRRVGFSVIGSPDDVVLDMTLQTSADGAMCFIRRNLRISEARPVRVTHHLVSHERDWRAPLGYLMGKYPHHWAPARSEAFDVAGCGAYTTFEGSLESERLRRMAFSVNWKASYDFPYMGMYLPPTKSPDERYPRFDPGVVGSTAPGQGTTTSLSQMSDYSRRMRADGFHVLNYFNVTEFGAGVKPEAAVRMDLAPSEQWRDCTTFLYRRIRDGILWSPDGGTYGTWGGAIAMDPGGPDYRSHLADQIRRHLTGLPDSSGICIDRTDWLAFYNPRADDGVSWRSGAAARYGVRSWRGLMSTLAPMVHSAGKVIFVNTHIARADLLEMVDGIYAEGGFMAPDYNMAALAGLGKPVIQWTASESDLGPDPDAYFQRHLYMGCFPTAPLPGNDHTILPSLSADKWYLDYGPMLRQLRGRTWVLSPGALQISRGVKANVFAVPGGYVVPVVFGGGRDRARITLRLPKLRKIRPAATAWFPGADRPAPCVIRQTGDRCEIDVRLARGCAMVRIASGSAAR